METTATKQEKRFELHDCYKGFSKKLIARIIQTIEAMLKTKDVIEIEGYQNKFIVRAGKVGEALYQEESKGVTILDGFITVKMIGSPEKKITFSVWTRIKSSKILV